MKNIFCGIEFEVQTHGDLVVVTMRQGWCGARYRETSKHLKQSAIKDSFRLIQFVRREKVYSKHSKSLFAFLEEAERCLQVEEVSSWVDAQMKALVEAL